jgi:cellulose synthase/poly-beta-1,6-N-acetylglucosamine synthase-like glycosyltransferase
LEAADARIVVSRRRQAAGNGVIGGGVRGLTELVFWIAAAIPLYAFAGYPLVLLGLGAAIRREVRKAPIRPLVSLLIPAYNEARVIARKIQNSLDLDYPADRIEIVIVSDGSSDDTVGIARRVAWETGGVRVLALPKNRGKVAALNAAVPELRGEIVVFSDASAMLAQDAVCRLVENFADPTVGAACGCYRVVKPNEVNIGRSEDIYWKYEAFLKTRESRLESTLGAHGHLHAIRKELYAFPPDETINDDYVIPLSVLRRGLRAVYEPSAFVFEEAREMTGFGRRIRIVAGNLQQLRHLGQFLKPWQPFPLLFFLSHKVVRLLVSFAMLAALAANLFLFESRTYRVLLCAQLLFYALAVLGLTGRLRPRALRLPFYFCMVNGAAFFGLYHALTRRRNMAWK